MYLIIFIMEPKIMRSGGNSNKSFDWDLLMHALIIMYYSRRNASSNRIYEQPLLVLKLTNIFQRRNIFENTSTWIAILGFDRRNVSKTSFAEENRTTFVPSIGKMFIQFNWFDKSNKFLLLIYWMSYVSYKYSNVLAGVHFLELLF